MRYDREKFRELEDQYMLAYSYNQTNEEEEAKLNKLLKEWKTEDLRDEWSWYMRGWRPSSGFMAYVNYTIGERIKEEDKEEDLLEFINKYGG